MDFSDLHLNNIKGFLAEAEARELYRVSAQASGLGPGLEIGSYCGKTAVCLGMGCRKNGAVLFSIDHHRGSEEQQPGQAYFDPDLLDPRTGEVDTFPHFRRTLRLYRLEDTVIPIVARSEDVARAWSIPLGFLFIDGGHSFAAAYRDYLNWSPHLRPGGHLLIHDLFPDSSAGGQAPRCVYEMAVASGLYEPLPRVETLGILRRGRPDEVTDYARTRWALY